MPILLIGHIIIKSYVRVHIILWINLLRRLKKQLTVVCLTALRKPLCNMVLEIRIELTAYRLGGDRSILLSYPSIYWCLIRDLNPENFGSEPKMSANCINQTYMQHKDCCHHYLRSSSRTFSYFCYRRRHAFSIETKSFIVSTALTWLVYNTVLNNT